MEFLARGSAELGIELDEAQLEQFRRFHAELVDWNTRANLTTVTGWEQVQVRHFLDSLAVLPALPAGLLDRGGRILDVGSGAGLPGIPLRIALQGLKLTLMDATAKKASFLTHVTGALGLTDVQVLSGRAEDLGHDPELREGFDAVVARAVVKLPVLAELCLPFCRRGGLVVAHKGPGVDDEVSTAAKAIQELGGRLRAIREMPLQGLGLKGVLVVLEKVDSTPDRYPRRPGIPAKRPL